MLTRIEINGFKSFRNFAIDFRPFQVFIGPNGVGKTNLFDAILLLSALASDHTLESAFRLGRGELVELFTVYPDGSRAPQMQFAAEMLIGKTITDSLGKPFDLGTTRLRYELTIERRSQNGRDSAHILSESLISLKDADDRWVKDQIPSKNRKTFVVRDKRAPYIATVGEAEQFTIYRNQDTLAGGREGTKVGDIQRTILGGSDPVRYPTIQAVRQEMQSWRALQLLPSAMRAPTPAGGSTTLRPDGANLAAVLDRLDRAQKLPAVLKDVRALLPSVQDLKIRVLGEDGEKLVEVETQDHSRFSSRVLSDGTLRLIGLVTLKNDPQHQGLICFEEPENGVQPQRLKQIVDVLYALSTDLSSDSDAPLRQVLINTHSPGLLTSVPADSLYYVGMRMQERGRETFTVPVRPELIPDENDRYYTWDQVTKRLTEMEEALKRVDL